MKTTQKQFFIFKKECQKWIDEFELNNWCVIYEFKDLGDNSAQSNLNIFTHNATIGLNTKLDLTFDRNISDDDYIKSLAKHEIIHLLLHRLASYGQCRWIYEDEFKEAEEETVIKLEKII